MHWPMASQGKSARRSTAKNAARSQLRKLWPQLSTISAHSRRTSGRYMGVKCVAAATRCGLYKSTCAS